MGNGLLESLLPPPTSQSVKLQKVKKPRPLTWFYPVAKIPANTEQEVKPNNILPPTCTQKKSQWENMSDTDNIGD